MTMARRDENRRYFRCEGCGDLTWCRRLATGIWECGGCVEHDLVESAARDRTERRIRTQLEEETSMNTGPITMAERERAVARRRGYSADDLADICKAREVRLLAFAEARDEQRAAQRAVEDEVEAVGRELGLDPATNYQHRRLVFDELVRRGHPIANERYGQPA
jgi:ribosomal protein L37AE/L43A